MEFFIPKIMIFQLLWPNFQMSLVVMGTEYYAALRKTYPNSVSNIISIDSFLLHYLVKMVILDYHCLSYLSRPSFSQHQCIMPSFGIFLTYPPKCTSNSVSFFLFIN